MRGLLKRYMGDAGVERASPQVCTSSCLVPANSQWTIVMSAPGGGADGAAGFGLSALVVE